MTGPARETWLERYAYPPEVRAVIDGESLLPAGLLERLHAQAPDHSCLARTTPFLFHDRDHYAGREGLRDVMAVLEAHGIDLGHRRERELFTRVYRFLASRHILNAIDWTSYEADPLYHLVIPQPGMLAPEVVEAYAAAGDAEAWSAVVQDYIRRHTNPHDGNQLLNQPVFDGVNGEPERLEGSQHKYPQCQLVFDETTQSCFAFCTYCFRHAQVRGDADMLVQRSIPQYHRYLRQHPEVTDVLITGGDAGHLEAERFEAYVRPMIEDPDLRHVRTVRLGSRALTYAPERILSPEYEPMLRLFRDVVDHGIQVAWMAHFSTPREVLNPSTIAAMRRLQAAGVVLRNQSPIVKHISLFVDDHGTVDVDRSAQSWIDLANLLATLRCGFHSMYCPRPTGEHHYFAAPLADLERVASKIHRSLPSINRPSRYLSMTTSAGKISLLGTMEVRGEKVFALKFTEGRDMTWLDPVFLARWDPKQDNVDLLEPFDRPEHFFRARQREIESDLRDTLDRPPE